MKVSIENLINSINEGGAKIYYLPIRSKDTLKNYSNSMLNKESFSGIRLNKCFWGFKKGPKNFETYNNMKLGDYIFFILRDDEGYEILDSIGVISELKIDSSIGKQIWDDDGFELIVGFDTVFVLANKLRLTYKRRKLDNILNGVSQEVFHNGYEMFRNWSMYKKDGRRRGDKLIEESELVNVIVNECGGSYIIDASSRVENSDDDMTTDINSDFENTIKNRNYASNFSGLNIVERESKKSDADLTLNKKVKRNPSDKFSLNKVNQKLIGLLGEDLVNSLLIQENEKLLNILGISPEDITEVNWSNKGFTVDNKDFEDSSLGYDFQIILQNRKELFLEVKTSYKNSGYYSLTNNELKEMAKYQENYYVVKVNYLKKFLQGELPEVIVEKFPIENILQNLNRIKGMEVYL